MAWDLVRSSYDRVAGTYEARFLDELAGKPRDRELLEAFAGAVGDPVVEIGCGPGHIGAYVRARGHRVLGADLSPVMAKLATGRLDAVLAADMRALPLAAGRVAGLLAFYSLIHVRRPEVALVLREFARVLRPGGRALLSAHEGEGEIELEEFLGERVPMVATFFGVEELVAASRAAGFEVVLAVRRPPYPTESDTVRVYLEVVRAEAVP